MKNWHLLSKKELESLDDHQIIDYRKWLDDIKLSAEMDMVFKKEILKDVKEEQRKKQIEGIKKIINIDDHE